jgi:hypothetical protein
MPRDIVTAKDYMSDANHDEVKERSVLYRQMAARGLADNQRMEHPSKTLERHRVEKIDALDDGMVITPAALLKSTYFHWWDGDDDAYFYWDLK